MAETIFENTVKTAPVPATGSATLWDDKIPGFDVRIHSSGTKSFFLNYRDPSGREKRITLGKFPNWTATMARKRASELRQEVDRGSDPAGEKRERRESPTIADLAERYIRDRIDGNNQARPKDEKAKVAEIVHILGKDTKVSVVHYGDMEELHRKITQGYEGKEPRPVRANRILAVASAMFTLSLRPLAGENRAWRNPVEGNPCTGIERNHEEPLGRLYTVAELERITDALDAYQGEVARDCVKLIMLTGCRPTEASRATWSQCEEAGFWTKPSSHTKQGKEHRVPLSPPARLLIEQLRAKRDPNSALVFPGHAKDGSVQLAHCWRTIRKRVGLGDESRLYDCRHTHASNGAMGGLSLPIIGRLLGHAVARTTERYAKHLADDPLQAATDKIADRLTNGPRLRVVNGG